MNILSELQLNDAKAPILLEAADEDE